MGAWGPAIFSDDTACDVRDDYRELIAQGITSTEATRRLVEEYHPDDDPDDTGFWLGLAATQWKLGRLEDTVKARALQIIEDGTDLRRWEEEARPQDARKRRVALERLREQLLSPQPAPRRIRPPYVQNTEFEAGDVVGYRLLSERYILLRVVGHLADKGGRYPVIEVVDWMGDSLPAADAIPTVGPKRPLPKPGANSHYTTRLMLVSWSKTDYPADRIQVVARGLPIAPLPGSEPGKPGFKGHHHPDVGSTIISWRQLDEVLREGFRLE